MKQGLRRSQFLCIFLYENIRGKMAQQRVLGIRCVLCVFYTWGVKYGIRNSLVVMIRKKFWCLPVKAWVE